jgi:hypothetical protein
LASAVRAGAPRELEALVRDLSQSSALLEIRRKSSQEDLDPQQHFELLYLVVRSVREALIPSLDAQETLVAEGARKVMRALYHSPVLMQAAKVRDVCGVGHQPTLTRWIKSLAHHSYVGIHRGPGNTAWYYLTPAGRIFLESSYPELTNTPAVVGRAPASERESRAQLVLRIKSAVAGSRTKARRVPAKKK